MEPDDGLAASRGLASSRCLSGANGSGAGPSAGMSSRLAVVKFQTFDQQIADRQSQLYEIKGVNVAVMLGAIMVLALASLLSGVIPARTAAATEPAQTLRAE